MKRAVRKRMDRQVVWALGCGFAASLGAAQTDPLPRFVDVAQEAGLTLLNVSGTARKDYIVEVSGNGAAFFDYDNDGDMDVLIVNGSTLERIGQGGDLMAALYANDGHGSFSNLTSGSQLNTKGWGMGVCVADYDNDGFRDVYITAFGPNVLYRNDGAGSFMDVTATAGLGNSGWSTNCSFGDYDRDGDLDLYVANYLAFDEKTVPKAGTSGACQHLGVRVMCGPRGLPGQPDALYRNDGDGTFTDVTETAGIDDPNLYGYGAVFSDLDDDGWLDIFVANDSVPNALYKNNQDGTFSEIGLLSGVALSGEGRPQSGMGLDIADYNNDGLFDIFVTHFSNDTNTLYRNNGAGIFTDETFAAGLAATSLQNLGWGTSFVDLDNDARLDIFVANGHIHPGIDNFGNGATYFQPKELYRNLGDGRFEEISEEIGGAVRVEKSSRGSAVGDFDNDGDMDILVINIDDRPTLLRNDLSNGSHWLTLQLVGTTSNGDGIGARVEIEAGGKTQVAEVRSGGSYLSHNDTRVHFGLGDTARVDELRIRWPNGRVEKFEGVDVDGFVEIEEGTGLVVEEPTP